MLSPYIAIARPDHWFKNIFMVPGYVLAITISGGSFSISGLVEAVIGVLAVCLIASANYTINEWLDADSDRHHPVKKNRPSATGLVTAGGVCLQWTLLAAVGVALSYSINGYFLGYNLLLLFMGILYNVNPVRTKDKQYLDVLSESINNPIRFMLGWTIATPSLIPPASVLIAYWMGGAFLMGIKRYSEYRFIGDPEMAGRYRRSFHFYNEETLLLSSFFYALTSAFFLGVFLIKYRVEFILAMPFLALMFTWYLKMGMQANSASQPPEKRSTRKSFILYVVFCGCLVGALMLVNIPALHILLLSVTELR